VVTGPAEVAYAIHTNNTGNLCTDGALFGDPQADGSFGAIAAGAADLVYTLTISG
jgi:hypothetical protein